MNEAQHELLGELRKFYEPKGISITPNDTHLTFYHTKAHGICEECKLPHKIMRMKIDAFAYLGPKLCANCFKPWIQ